MTSKLNAFYGVVTTVTIINFLYSAPNQETLASVLDDSTAITSRVNYEEVYSATSLDNTTTIEIIETDDQQDHTYDTTKFHNQIDTLHKQPQYNTLQRGNNGGITNYGLRFDAYDKIEIHMSKDANNCSKFMKQIPRTIHRIDSYHDEVEATFTYKNKMGRTPQMMSQDYEPVYHESNCTQVDKPTGKQLGFDDEAYGTHKPASVGEAVKLGVDRIECTPHSEIIKTVKEEISTANKEVQHAEPPAPNEKGHVQDAQAKPEHFYHSLELNEPTNPEKCISDALYSKEGKDQVTVDANYKCQTQMLTSLHDSYGAHTMDEVDTTNAPILFNLDKCEPFDDPMYEGIPHSVPKQTNNKNPSLSKMHHFVSTEVVSCIGDVNADPDLLDCRKDTNTPDYSDPIVPKCLDDSNMANDQEDTTVNIYNTFDDPTL